MLFVISWIFSKSTVLKNSFRNHTIRASNSFDPDQAWLKVRPDLGSNCLLKSSLIQVQTVCKGYQQTTLVHKELKTNVYRPRMTGKYCKFRNFSRGLYFRETLHMQSFMKIKPLQNGKITLLFIDIGTSCLSRKFFTSLICLLILFTKIKFSRKFPNLRYQSL